MAELTTAWMLGCVCGFFLGATVAGRRRPTCRELMRDHAPRQPTFAELLLPLPPDRDPDLRRSFNHENTARNSNEARPRKLFSGYQPRSQGGPTNRPPQNP